jgi:hypothetical protein
MSATPLAASTGLVAVPTDCELFAILLALLAAERCSYAALAERTLTLDNDNFERVTRVIGERFPLFFWRTPKGHDTRSRLAQLYGISVTCLTG